MILFIITLFLTLLTVSLSQALAPSKKSNEAIHFIALSDIHLDPFHGCHFSKVCKTVYQLASAPIVNWHDILLSNRQQKNPHLLLGMDTNQYLFDKTLVQLKKQIKRKKPEFIVITGDFIAHGIDKNYQRYFNSSKGYENFIRKLFQYIHSQLQAAAPKLPIYFVMGNNDGYLGDYVSNAGLQFFKDIKQDWPDLSQPQEHNSDLLDRSGNYAITTKNNKWRLVMLNTHLFYKKTKGENKKAYADESLIWLDKQLNFAKKNKQKVLLFYHIPYGIQPSKRYLPADVAALWTAESNNAFLALTTQHKDIIKGLFHGHLHREAFMKLHKNTNKALPQKLICAISPIFGNESTLSVIDHKDDRLTLKQITI